MNKNILLEPKEAVLHTDNEGYLSYQSYWGVASFHIDATTCGFWAGEFFKTPDGKVKTVLGTGKHAATLIFKAQAQPPVVARNEYISEGPADAAFLLALNGTITTEVA